MYITDAIVLRVWEKGENDFMVSFFTKDFGKMVITVRGAKKIETKQGNLLHKFSVVKIMFIMGRHSPILRSIMEVRFFPEINSNLYGYGYLSSFLVLCDKILYENTKDEGLWDLLNSAISDVSLIIKENKKVDMVCRELWSKEKEWLYLLIDIMGVKEYNEIKDIDKIDNRKKVDLFFKERLEKSFNIPVDFFGLILKEKHYEPSRGQ